jgi:DNA-binding LacI/PurR family transcriptional regulator
VIDTDFSAGQGGEATKQLIADPAAHWTAITYSNDRMALAGIGVAQRAGLSIPRDLSIAAFDESDIASFTYPSLTSVVTDAAEWGALAARTLLAAIAGIELADAELAPARLVARESTAAAPIAPRAR